MHELSIAQALIEQATAAARSEGGTRILSVGVAIGDMAGVDPEALEFAFPVAAAGTIAEGATLAIRRVPLEVRCRRCGQVSHPQPIWCRCEACESSEVGVTAGRELRLEQLEIERANG